MKTQTRAVGFIGIGKLATLGPASDVNSFFTLVGRCYNCDDKALLCDLLYRRAIRQEQLNEVRTAMAELQKVFSGVKQSAIDWSEIGVDVNCTALKRGGSLADAYESYFCLFEDVAQYSLLFLNRKGEYLPVRIGYTDVGWFVADERRPVEEYDKLEGLPFWLKE